MFRAFLAIALTAAAAAPLAPAGEPTPSAFDDAAFLKAVAIGGLYDVCICELVGSQTRDAEVRKLAAAVVADHVIARDGLKAAAKEVGVELPTKLDAEHQKQFEAFKAGGKGLDRELVKALHKRLTAGAAAFALASKRAENSAVRAFAAKALPRLQKHLETAKNLAK